jgi:hypothetical protein
MPRKAKKEEQHIDIVEIDYEQEMPEHEQETARQQPTNPQSDNTSKPSVSAKRLEALAKGREKARLNRLKKKEEEKQQLKEQLKQELMMNQKREPSPDRKVKQQKPHKHELAQELSESENELEQEPVEPKHAERAKEKKPQKPQPPPPGKHAVKPQSKAEEQKKVLQKAKKNIPVFKEESKPKREARVRDFFKPKKVIEVSDDESN